jgi:monoamine oxidase
VAWAGGPRAEALLAQGPDAVLDAAVGSVSRAFGLPRARVETSLEGAWTHDWARDPYAGGAYSFALPGGLDAHRALSRPVDGTIFFAGEHTMPSPMNATVHGALESGIRAAERVILSLRVPRGPRATAAG